MPGGKGKIRSEDRTAGFDVHPENINRKGAPLSVRKQIREILEQDGKITIKKEHVIEIKDDGSIVVLMPKRDVIAMKLIQWAMSSSGSTSIRAIQLIMEHLEGKPAQSVSIIADEPINQINLTDEQLDKIMLSLEPKEPKKKKK